MGHNLERDKGLGIKGKHQSILPEFIAGLIAAIALSIAAVITALIQSFVAIDPDSWQIGTVGALLWICGLVLFTQPANRWLKQAGYRPIRWQRRRFRMSESPGFMWQTYSCLGFLFGMLPVLLLFGLIAFRFLNP